MKSEFVRVEKTVMHFEFERVLLKCGYSEPKAEKLSSVFTLNSLEGVYSHGVNRFPRFIRNTMDGLIITGAEPELINKAGCIEQWAGKHGPGPLNAEFATLRSMSLAEESTMGMVALSGTNHWMRAGAYGWLAARKGFVLICWTNTCPNMPAWGGKDPKLGNNPLVIAVPYRKDAIVLDFAMSQYSYGKLESYLKEGKQLPYPGGYDSHGTITSDPAKILHSWRVLPAGYWKGSSLSLMLDILATILTGGLSVHEIKSCETETNISQVFIAINIRNLYNYPGIDDAINRIITDLHDSIPAEPGSKIRYPGENIEQIRNENLISGISVRKDVWERIKVL
ncbi:MAG TPA: 3-dehydro-L-gulonate 2-dehydrogenase [Bacteroidales bacterium]|nr:3-dehydro-L-gulonate 2-dehydrogenase [Bacteroidales bacterium]